MIGYRNDFRRENNGTDKQDGGAQQAGDDQDGRFYRVNLEVIVIQDACLVLWYMDQFTYYGNPRMANRHVTIKGHRGQNEGRTKLHNGCSKFSLFLALFELSRIQ
jgi:hypothetical protein